MTTETDGAAFLVRYAHAAGIDICFANPGTTELDLVGALRVEPGIRAVLGLFEGVCTGAADGYARVSGRPALTLLHLGPGLANGLANLHNARRAGSPMVNIIGDHATWHLRFDAPLTSDIDTLARPMSGAVVRLDNKATYAVDVERAFTAAANRKIVTLVAPTDLMVAPFPAPDLQQAAALASPSRAPVDAARVAASRARLDRGGDIVLLLGGNALTERGVRAAGRVAAATGARLLMETYPAIASLGGDLPRLERLAYFPEDIVRQIAGAEVILAGARPPVSYFGYEGRPSEPVPADCQTLLASPDDDAVDALERLAEAVRDLQHSRPLASPPPVPAPSTSLTPDGIVEEVLARMPEEAIISIEGSTLGGPYLRQAHRAPRHRVMTNTGGAIGQGLPCALGAALAAPDTRVIALQSDGSAQYTLQALWTMAREKAPVTIVIAANHRYAILQTELKRSGIPLDADVVAGLTRLDQPAVDWVALATGYGVPAMKAVTPAEFAAGLKKGLATDGPFLIQAELD